MKDLWNKFWNWVGSKEDATDRAFTEAAKRPDTSKKVAWVIIALLAAILVLLVRGCI